MSYHFAAFLSLREFRRNNRRSRKTTKGEMIHMVSIAVCEQQEMIREALVKAMAPMKDVTVLVAENNGHAFVQAVQQHKPEVMVIDVAHPSGEGLEVARSAKAAHRNGKLVTLVDDEDDAALVNSYELGASAVVSKKRPVKDLHQAVLDVAASVNTINPIAVRNAKRRSRRSPRWMPPTERCSIFSPAATPTVKLPARYTSRCRPFATACRDSCSDSTWKIELNWPCTWNASIA
jgi:DNA-binding NarL/FixJ family response regulator